MKKIRTLLAILVMAAFLLVPIYAWITKDVYALTLFGRNLVGYTTLRVHSRNSDDEDGEELQGVARFWSLQSCQQ